MTRSPLFVVPRPPSPAFSILHFVFCILLAACAPAIRSDVEAQVYLTQSAINRTATAEAQATKTADDLLLSQIRVNEQEAESLRLENERALLAVETARREMEDADRQREAEYLRQQAEWAAEQTNKESLYFWSVLGLITFIVIVLAIIGYQFFLFTDGVRQLRYQEAYQKSQSEIWRLRAEASKHLLEATENARRKTSHGELEWDYEAGQWRPALPPPAPPPPPASLETQWRMAAYHVALWAAQYGFGETAFRDEALVRDPATGQFWEDGRRKLMELLDAMGVTYARQGKARTWAGGWDIERFERDYWHLPTPPLPNIAVPVVSVPLRSSAIYNVTKLRSEPEVV